MKPFTDLLSSKRIFQWGPAISEAFKKVKEKLTNSPLLALYNPSAETKVSADASSFRVFCNGQMLIQSGEQ